MSITTTAVTTAVPTAAYALTTSGLFAIRNVDKASDGDFGRWPVFLGQTYKFIDNINKNVSIFDNLAKSDNALVKGATKAANFASKNINGLIGVSSAIKVAQADNDKRKEVMFTESVGLAGMFAGEGWMKKHSDEVLTKIIDKISSGKADIPALKKDWRYNIAKAVAFVGVSIGSSTAASKAAEQVAPTLANPVAPKERIA